MRLFRIKILSFVMLASTLTFAISSIASAHVAVKPSEAVTAGYQTFTVGVPSEKEVPTVAVKILIPDSVQSVTPTQKPGWKITEDKKGTGETATVKSITWSGGTIDADLRDEFTFSAKVPDQPTELQWKAYQTYGDGSVVSWDKAGDSEEEGSDSGPFSVTKVVTQTSADTNLKNTDQTANDAKNTANTALYLAGAAIVLGLAGVFLATRKK